MDAVHLHEYRLKSCTGWGEHGDLTGPAGYLRRAAGIPYGPPTVSGSESDRHSVKKPAICRKSSFTRDALHCIVQRDTLQRICCERTFRSTFSGSQTVSMNDFHGPGQSMSAYRRQPVVFDPD